MKRPAMHKQACASVHLSVHSLINYSIFPLFPKYEYTVLHLNGSISLTEYDRYDDVGKGK